ncbi:MAG: ATP synthase complex assembly protein atp12 [Geoglossum simile]|nr:MAG: ATP synthase complex assembly protein atp12 [Geoglossum simile]
MKLPPPLTRPLASDARALCYVRVIAPIHRYLLHTTSPAPATPLPVTAHGPPPKPPAPAAKLHDRIARRRRQAELIGKSGDGGGAKKRFWKDVKVHEAPGPYQFYRLSVACLTLIRSPDGLQIHLDHRPIRTPSKNILTLPHSKPHLATAIALEWDVLTSASQALRQHLIPLTSLVSRAAEIQEKDSKDDSRVRDEIIAMAMRYLDTDTLLCWAPTTLNTQAGSQLRFVEDNTASRSAESLRDIQMRIARPIMDLLTAHVWPGVELFPITDENSIMPRPQPEMTKKVVRGWISGLPAFELAGLERAVLAGKSLLVAARLLVEWSIELRHVRLQQQQQERREEEGAEAPQRFGVEEAAEAADLEVRWQTGMWGEVEDTHDVNKEDLRSQLGSVILLVSGEE